MAEDPLRTTTFTLTRADALAYEQVAGHMSPLGVLALLLWLGVCGAVAWLIPADWAGPALGFSFSLLASILIAIGYVLVLIGIAARHYWRAGQRIPRPLEITLTEWPNRLSATGAGFPAEIKFTDIRESILARDNLFLVTDDGVLILPRRAFPEDGVIDALAARIAGRPAPVPVDAGAAPA
ncbi:MAG: hypothetical protein ABIQ30_11500 [Devosia sp.]